MFGPTVTMPVAANKDGRPTLPSFVCIGTQRGGTTWLFDCLAEHPGLFLLDCKDLHFFRGWHGRPSLYETYGLALYQRLFQHAPPDVPCLDISAGLLAGEGVAEQMREALPDCRLIAILRNPVDRAVSHHTFVTGRTGAPYTLQQLAANPGLDDPHEILPEGLYARHLKAFFRHYPRDRFLIIFFEDLVAGPDHVFQAVCDFMGLAPGLRPRHLHTLSNRPIRYRIKSLNAWNEHLGAFLLVNGLEVIRKVVRRTGLPDLVRRLNGTPLAKPELDRATRQALIEYYRQDVLELGQMLGRDLKGWLV